MSLREFRDWTRYYDLEPWGDARDDVRMGILAATTANCHKKQGAPAFTPSQFIPDFTRARTEKKPSEEDQAAFRKHMAALVTKLRGNSKGSK